MDTPEQPHSLAERTALNLIQQHPRWTDRRFAEHLGKSLRGVEDMLRRLRRRGIVFSEGHGPARRLSLAEAAKSHVKRGVDRSTKDHVSRGVGTLIRQSQGGVELSLDEEFDRLLAMADRAVSDRSFRLGLLVESIDRFLNRLNGQTPHPSWPEVRIQAIRHERNHAFAIAFCQLHAGPGKHIEAAQLLGEATPDQLAKFFDQTRGNLRSNNPTPLLLPGVLAVAAESDVNGDRVKVVPNARTDKAEAARKAARREPEVES